MAMEQEEERLSKLKEEAKNELPEGWNNPLRIIELYKKNIKLTLEKEELQRAMDDDVAEKADIVLEEKETITGGVEKKTRGDMVVEKWRLYNQLWSTLKQIQDASFFKTTTHIL